MFEKGTVWAYPTDTSFGLGVRVDDEAGLQALKAIKRRPESKYFSVMVRDIDMLCEYAEVPILLTLDFFIEKPRTVLLKPSKKMPKSPFWPIDSVAFRVCLLPEIAQHITMPVTTTSANISSFPAIFSVRELRSTFGDNIKIYDAIPELPRSAPSEIWDFTVTPRQQIR